MTGYKKIFNTIKKSVGIEDALPQVKELRAKAGHESRKGNLGAILLWEYLKKVESQNSKFFVPSIAFVDNIACFLEASDKPDDSILETAAKKRFVRVMGQNRSLFDFSRFNTAARKYLAENKGTVTSLSAQPIGGLQAALTVTYKTNKDCAQRDEESLKEIISSIAGMDVQLTHENVNGVRLYTKAEFKLSPASIRIVSTPDLEEIKEVILAMKEAGVPLDDESVRELGEEIFSCLDKSTLVDVDVLELERILRAGRVLTSAAKFSVDEQRNILIHSTPDILDELEVYMDLYFPGSEINRTPTKEGMALQTTIRLPEWMEDWIVAALDNPIDLLAAI